MGVARGPERAPVPRFACTPSQSKGCGRNKTREVSRSATIVQAYDAMRRVAATRRLAAGASGQHPSHGADHWASPRPGRGSATSASCWVGTAIHRRKTDAHAAGAVPCTTPIGAGRRQVKDTETSRSRNPLLNGSITAESTREKLLYLMRDDAGQTTLVRTIGRAFSSRQISQQVHINHSLAPRVSGIYTARMVHGRHSTVALAAGYYNRRNNVNTVFFFDSLTFM